jgi:hypothetical protein
MPVNKNIKIIINYFLGPLVFLLLLYAIYRQTVAQHRWRESLASVTQAIYGPQQWKIWMVILLMFLNWALEARKWQLVIRPLQPLGFWQCYKATFTGVTMASFTPNRTGDYFGRMLYIEEGKRAGSVPPTILCSFAQTIITLLAGCFGLFFFKFYTRYQAMLNWKIFYLWLNIMLVATVFILLIFLFFYFRISWFARYVKKIWPTSKLLCYLKVLEDFNATKLTHLLSLSLLRYIVFIVQYYLMFSVFGITLSLTETLSGMSVVFLVIAVIPSFTFLSELGVRWEASIQIMELFGASTVSILATSFGIWLVNLIIPALIGSLLILGIKLFRIKS